MTRRSTREAATRDPFGRLRLLRLLAGIVLLAAVSWEVLAGDNLRFSQTYLTIQLIVCLVFLADFFVRWAAAGDRGRYLRRNLLYLLISIPWLNISAWCGADMTHDWGLVVGMMPLVRAFLAMAIVVEWLVGDNRIHRLFAAYLFTVVVFTYLSALVFYDYEVAVNPPAPRLRQRPVVGLDERDDRRCGDLPRHGRRQGRLRAAAVARHAVLPDLHDLHSPGVRAPEKTLRPITAPPRSESADRRRAARSKKAPDGRDRKKAVQNGAVKKCGGRTGP